MAEINEIIRAIEAYQPSDDWLGLQALLDELFAHPLDAIPAEPFLRIFERFPNEDGYGVFWTVLHGLEALPKYEAALFASLRRFPTQFGLTMARRILNSKECVQYHSAVHTIAHELSCSRHLPDELADEVKSLLADLPPA
jgi:hypothetical protein